SISRSNKTKTFSGIKPLNCTFTHVTVSLIR
ncbi:MAG: hypothetical protein ACI9FD_004688, partial [Gammaproteobacteria bacterium]